VSSQRGTTQKTAAQRPDCLPVGLGHQDRRSAHDSRQTCGAPRVHAELTALEWPAAATHVQAHAPGVDRAQSHSGVRLTERFAQHQESLARAAVRAFVRRSRRQGSRGGPACPILDRWVATSRPAFRCSPLRRHLDISTTGLSRSQGGGIAERLGTSLHCTALAHAVSQVPVTVPFATVVI